MAAVITRAEFSQVKETVDDHDEWINGNGKKGAKERLGLLEDGLERIERRLTAITALITSVGLALLVMMLWLIEQHVK